MKKFVYVLLLSLTLSLTALGQSASGGASSLKPSTVSATAYPTPCTPGTVKTAYLSSAVTIKQCTAAGTSWDTLAGGTSSSPTFVGITLSGATANTVPYFNGSKALTSSAVTPTQLSYLDATSSVQTQLNAKVGTTLTTNRIPYGVAGVFSSSSLLTFEPSGAFSRLTVTATGSNVPSYFDIVPTGNAGSYWRQTGGTGVMAFNNVNGTGVQFYSNSLLSLDVRHATTSVNYAKITGAATGAGAIYGVDGADTNININLTPKGSGDVSITTGNLLVATAGKSLQIKAGSNACSGSSTLSSGTVTVSTTCTGTTWGTDFIILLTPRGSSTGVLRVSTHTAATSFVITSTDAASSDPVGWMIVKQN